MSEQELVKCPNSYHGLKADRCRVCWGWPGATVPAALSVEYELLNIDRKDYTGQPRDTWGVAVDALRKRHGRGRG